MQVETTVCNDCGEETFHIFQDVYEDYSMDDEIGFVYHLTRQQAQDLYLQLKEELLYK